MSGALDSKANLEASDCILIEGEDNCDGKSSGALDSKATLEHSEDLRMIQEQLRQFNDVSITERQSIIRDHLQGSAARLDESYSLNGKRALLQPEDSTPQVVDLQERLECMNLASAEPPLELKDQCSDS